MRQPCATMSLSSFDTLNTGTLRGGTGTASRVVQAAGNTYTVGALVQANYGARGLLRVDGVPVDQHRKAAAGKHTVIVVAVLCRIGHLHGILSAHHSPRFCIDAQGSRFSSASPR